jgi:hypothetical protein
MNDLGRCQLVDIDGRRCRGFAHHRITYFGDNETRNDNTEYSALIYVCNKHYKSNKPLHSAGGTK